jgi:hypothetical protein
MHEVKQDTLTKKILKLYKNYGLDVSSISDEEIERIKPSYKKKGNNIDSDLKKSEDYIDEFAGNII